jgi:hypothetical protein
VTRMRKYDHPKSFLRLPIFACSLLVLVLFSNKLVLANDAPASDKRANLNTGYSALALFLQDEQYLTIIRRTKAVLMFEGISESSKQLVDNISETSAKALEQLEYLASSNPGIKVEGFPRDSIITTTMDAMRMTAAKELLFNSDDFEKNLLLSQVQILRVISHLAREIQHQEPNLKRKDWLGKLAEHYEGYYRQVYARISITPPSGG